MKVKALVSFAGAFNMHLGEVRECSDATILSDLLKAGYVETIEAVDEKSEVKEPEEPQNQKSTKKTNKKTGDANESKPDSNK